MKQRQFKSQASSGRASNAFGGFGGSSFGTGPPSVLSYVQEPPDYVSIDDPNLVVAFKNLSKKDGTTKAKALEDLQAHASPVDAEITDAVLEAWTKLFPRLSIDTTRRVRQLSHALNGQICLKCGKRTVKHMPRIAGPWMAGTFDNDRAVARAASDALNLVFPTPAKIQGVRKTFQKSILEFCQGAALHETVSTLSDERVVSSDEANATYARVVATCLTVITSLITGLQPEDREKEQQLYEEVFQDATLWSLVSNTDPGVRRSTHRLVRTVLEQQPELMQGTEKTISNSYIYKGLNSDQQASAVEFILTLDAFTTRMPSIWTDAYSGKKPAISRLRHFLKQGSQSTSVEYWNVLRNLIEKLPQQILPATAEDMADLLSSARTGVTRKEERFNASSAWPAYFVLVEIVTSSNSSDNVEDLLDKHVLPVVRQYLYPSAETADWSVTGAKAASTVSKVTMIKKMTPLLAKEWPVLSDRLVETAKLSQPEQSKDFDKSQNNVATVGERWADLQRELWKANEDFLETMQRVFVATNANILNECLDLLRARTGKPYGAAAVIEQLLHQCSQHLMQDETFRSKYVAFAEDDMPGLMFSASQRQLVNGLYAVSADPAFPTIFANLLQGILDANEPLEAKLTALRQAFPQSTPNVAVASAKDTPKLQKFLSQNISAGMPESGTMLFADLVKLKIVPTETADSILSNLVSSLSISDQDAAALEAIDLMTNADDQPVKEFIAKSSGNGDQLLPSLLRLEQSPDDTLAEKATALSSRLSTAIGKTNPETKFNVVLRNLEDVSHASLPVDSLLDLTARLLGEGGSIQNASDMLPSLELWQSALRATLKPPKQSLAILSPLGGAVHWVNPSAEEPQERAHHDGEGLSQALRIAMYVSRLLAETDLLLQLGEFKDQVLALVQVTTLAAEDNVSILGTNDLWRTNNPQESEAMVLEFVGEVNKVLDKHWRGLPTNTEEDAQTKVSTFTSALETVHEGRGSSSPLAYYVELAIARVRENQFEHHGFAAKHVESSETLLKACRSDKQLFPLLSVLVGFSQPLSGSQVLSRYCNELGADLTDLNIAESEQKGLEKLIILNTILQNQEDGAATIAKQRLIFLVKRVLAWLEGDSSLLVKAEACKLLAKLFPGMADMYGEHWEQALSALTSYWISDVNDADHGMLREGNILLRNASLRLLATLKKLAKSEEPNDDLVDALKDKEDQIRDGLVKLLISANGVSDETHQPLMVTHELLARQIGTSPFKPLPDLGDLYPLMYTPSRPIQHAAFDLLHKQIPSVQEQISFDAAIDNKTAELPDELLSLILEAPTLDSLADAPFDRIMPLSLQGYLFSWRLLFDHFNGSSYRVKGDYIEQLKDGTYLTDLLAFTFDFLGHTRGRPVDVSKFDIQSYVPDTEPSPEKDVQWLLTHLYFLALTHLPSLVKSYYLDIRSRQTSQAIENWTAKYISPLVINASLKAVDEWSEKSVKEDPDHENVNVKVGMKSKEITVNFVVDEQTMAMKVVLPEAYPLASAQVQGVNRVAVKEEKWQSWLRNCQGVITFSNGSITDGLIAWRKNVTGTLKGQTECSICYSIISGDKQLPTKRCPTCKHLFHSSCLLKWFKTSNASTCPLCRNPFNFN